MAVIGFIEGFWETLANFEPANPAETGKFLISGRNIARQFVQLGRCISLSKSSALPRSKLGTAMHGS